MTTPVPPNRRRLSRRVFLKTTAAIATLAAAKTAFPFGANVAHAAGPETTKAMLGFIALTDASPLIVAREKGLFAKHGMPDVEVVKQASWGTTRDNLVLGSAGNGIDGAHILTPMPYLMTHRQGDPEQRAAADADPRPPQSRCAGDLGRRRLCRPRASAPTPASLKEAFAKKKAEGAPAKVAMTFPGGTHDLWLRYWLAAGGIDPDKRRRDDRGAAAADGRQHEGRHHGRLLRRRAVERAARQPEASATRPSTPPRSGRSIRKNPSPCAPTGSTPTRTPPRRS